MYIAAGQNQSTFAELQVTLAQRDAAILCRFNRQNPSLVLKHGIGRSGDGLLLHRGVDVDPLHAGFGQILAALGRLQRLAEQLFHVLRPDPFAPAHQRTGIERQTMDEELETAEVHQIAVLQQSAYHRLAAFIESVLHVMRPDHHPGQLYRTPLVGIKSVKLGVKGQPVDLVGQHQPRVFAVQNLVEPGPE